MIKKLLTTLCVIGFALHGEAQTINQFFEGGDTTLLVDIQNQGTSAWIIGDPDKTIFDDAYSVPNAIFTSAGDYPSSDSSSFVISYDIQLSWQLIYAFHWMQKLDLEEGVDFGFVEFSADTGATWQTVFDNPFVYNFYGFDSANVDTASNGMVGFTGTDSSWANIWVCFDGEFYNRQLMFRFSIGTDSVNTSQEGWIMDNFYFSETSVHTVSEEQMNQTELIKVYPSISSGRVYVKLKHTSDELFIEGVTITNAGGQIVQQHGRIPMKFFFDLSDQPNGKYFVTIATNQKTETFPIILQR